MFENDSIQAFHRKQPKKPQKMRAMGVPATGKRDEFIMDTNSSSIVSKRSVEKLYYPKQPEYFRYFVRKFQRRSPLINRGYWLRMKAIDKTVENFLREDNGKIKVVVNLGCGYDPLPFQYLGIHPERCRNCVFVDVDYPQLMQKKLEVIRQNQPLLDLLAGIKFGKPDDAVLGDAEKYKALGCDLKNVSSLDQALRKMFDLDNCSWAFLFVAEVSVAYMEKPAANAVLKWAAGLSDARFCLLEQHLPDGEDHPFAVTMLKHFRKLRTPLHAIGTLATMRDRFEAAGWPSEGVDLKTLWELWSNDDFVTPTERRSLDKVEPFDEWEEFALFGSHYFLLRATNNVDHDNDEEAKPGDIGRAASTEESCSRTLNAEIISGPSTSRRFAAAVRIPGALEQDILRTPLQGVAHLGGLGTRERLKSGDIYQEPAHDLHSTEKDQGGAPRRETATLPDLPSATMCHTITSLGGPAALLVGGRASPDKASNACFILQDGVWEAAHNLPVGRFRHCAVHIDKTDGMSQNKSTVLVYGGKTSQGDVLDDWLLYDFNSGWQRLEVTGENPEPRFGAAMSVDGTGGGGWLSGGMSDDGTVIADCWLWNLDSSDNTIRVHCQRKRDFGTQRNAMSHALFRFGAQIARCGSDLLLIGGISGGKMLDRDNEIVLLDDGIGVTANWSQRPLLVGFSAQSYEGGLLMLGGGATCFSFGTFWSQSQNLTLDNLERRTWSVMETSTLPFRESTRNLEPTPPEKLMGEHGNSIDILRRTIATATDFQSILLASQPVILEKLDLGICTKQWTTTYLKEKIGTDRSVVVHDSPTPKMSFSTKNFSYKTVPFGSLIDRAEDGDHVYLRALSSEKPADSPTELAKDFPSIAEDFKLPPGLAHVVEHAHSSPLRISGPVNMWLHYDVMANVLCQIKGSKRLLLYHPSDVSRLGLPPGASSSPIDPFDPSPEDQAALRHVKAYEAVLNEGDVLFIPPLWLHTAKPLSKLSVAVNVFFKDNGMETAYAAGKDVYGNRDIAAYERGRRDIQKILKGFDGLPGQVRTFYMERLAAELRSSI
ncbi:cupin-like domain-containing protein 4 [Elsinoe australis]|uniref:tRNA wybutosine-synthesizing protein 4 n=1 Tax=Elsinoe australis TaxID=40998 RepID=A0A4V6DTU0_9PEZI|nr:cupin-like domain-containing protein 4 [Elsinoe australis]